MKYRIVRKNHRYALVAETGQVMMYFYISLPLGRDQPIQAVIDSESVGSNGHQQMCDMLEMALYQHNPSADFDVIIKADKDLVISPAEFHKPITRTIPKGATL